MVLIIIGIILAGGAAKLITEGNTSSGIPGLIVAVLLLLLGLWRRSKKKATSDHPHAQASPAPQPAVSRSVADPPKPSYSFISFNVAGTSFNNDDGSSRQQILRKIKFGDPPFEDQDNLFVEVRPYEYEGSPAYAIYVDGHQIGSAPSTMVPKLQVALQSPDAIVSGFHVVGGGEGYNYGAEMAVRYTP